MRLEQLGWNEYFQALFAEFPGQEAGRVVRAAKGRYRVATEDGERSCTAAVEPVVGDWVALRGERIKAVLERRTKLSRKRPGGVTAEQVLAANVDVALLVSGLGGDYNPNRLERYLALAWESGARPVIVLNKADLASEAETVRQEAERLGMGAPVVLVSALTGEGLDDLAGQIHAGETAVLLGSSGVGKSTILNRLLGAELQRTNEVRASDGRGRHTTTRRELIGTPQGWLLIDTPGLRELQLWHPGRVWKRRLPTWNRAALSGTRWTRGASKTTGSC
ncbi:MAG: ribosome small subunit-dependent GTPase A, partial [bacterium]|nr:ribosome small subunit-dependent GTPase A [bacterium]